MKAQYGILRFKKYKGPAITPIEAHNERTKEQYASNPDIDTNRSRYNLHLVRSLWASMGLMAGPLYFLNRKMPYWAFIDHAPSWGVQKICTDFK